MNSLTIVAAKIKNPLDGILPDFSFGGQEFTELWQKLVAAIWAGGIIVAIVFLVIGITAMAGAEGSSNPNAHAVGKKKATWAFIALVGLAALAVIVGVTLSIGN